MIIHGAAVAFSGATELKISDVRITDGCIAAISGNLTERYPDDAVIDARGLWLMPGGIDPHVHFYDPGYTEKEDFLHGTGFAAAGGITTIIDMPCTSKPPVCCLDHLTEKHAVVKPKAVVDYAFHGGMSRQLMDSGPDEPLASLIGWVTGVKCYGVSGMDDVWGALDYYRMSILMRKARELGLPVLLHAEDASYVNNATAAARAAGADAIQWYRSRPEIAEILAVRSAVAIAEETDADLHIVHLGTGKAAETVAQSPERISGETCPHYLEFTLDDYLAHGAVMKIAPPVKSAGNRERLWQLLADGSISFVASDHAPGTVEEKSGTDIWQNSCGIPGVGTLLPYTLARGYIEGRLSLARYLEVISENAARRFGLWDRKGSIEPGKHADLVLIDPDSTWTINGRRFFSKGHQTPFEGTKLSGRVEKTLVRGRIVFDRSELTDDNAVEAPLADAAGWGELLKPVK
ncbi:MAG: dihydroorotase [Spirochaetaceae bacterium]|nr:MAG: dihydroorotase [Spirochaetaceae bacterium]